MRNPLKKIQKKINFRLANNSGSSSNTTSNNNVSPKSSPSRKARVGGINKGNNNGEGGPSSHSATSATDIHNEDPLFNNNRNSSSKLPAKSSNNNNSRQGEAIKKKKGKGRLSFTGGGRKSIGSIPPHHPNHHIDVDEYEQQQQQQALARSKSLSPSKISRIPPPSPPRSSLNKNKQQSSSSSVSTSFDAAYGGGGGSIVAAAPKSSINNPKIAPATTTTTTTTTTKPPSSSSNNNNDATISTTEIIDPLLGDRYKIKTTITTKPTSASASASSSNINNNNMTTTKMITSNNSSGSLNKSLNNRSLNRSLNNKSNNNKKQQQLMRDPNLERIAKAAAALDNTGNALFEKGEYDKAMANYVKALKLKNRTLAGQQKLIANNNNNTTDSDSSGAATTTTNAREGNTVNDKSAATASAAVAAAAAPATNSSAAAAAVANRGSSSNTRPASSSATAPVDPNNNNNNNNKAKPEQQSDDLWISVATSINNIGYLRQQSGQASAEETMQAYQNSLQIKRRVLGKDNLSVGKTLNNLGTVHYLKREYEDALKAYQEALQIMMATLGPHHLDVGTVHSNIGDVYWAQSADVVKTTTTTTTTSSADSDNNNNTGTKQNNGSSSNNNNDAAASSSSAQENYQASRDAALQHYRQSLEIRWEQLKDHHDPKVIRLLEKIAALEMGESFLALVQNNYRHRQSPAKASVTSAAATTAGSGSPDSVARSVADEALEAQHTAPVEKELQTLQEEVRSDVKELDMMERKMAIDMVKDKLRLVREMKKLSNLSMRSGFSFDDDDDDFDFFGGIGSEAATPIKVQPLSPEQRSEALCAVKQRLKELRESRTKDDLKETDPSPSNFFLSQRATQLLNRLQPPAPLLVDDNDLNKLRKFTFNLDEVEEENDPEAGCSGGSSSSNNNTSDEQQQRQLQPQRPAFDVSRKASHALEEGIDALRSLPLNQDNIPKDGGNPWVISSSTSTTAPEKPPMRTPQAPVPATSMAAYC